MTLIVAALAKKKGFLFGDQTRTSSSKNGGQKWVADSYEEKITSP